MNNGKHAELIAITDYTKRGYEIYLPLGSGGSCDFIAIRNEESIKIEVKSTTSENCKVELRRRFYKEHKKYKVSSDITYLINLNSGTVIEVPSVDLEGRTCITVR